MKQVIRLLFATILTITISCNYNRNKYQSINIDDFYTRSTSWDYIRIPLVKPFELVNLKGNEGWIINTSLWEYHKGDISAVDSIQCNDTMIAGHAKEYIDFENEKFNTPELWFVINFKTKKIHSFLNYNDFQEIKEANNLMPVDSIYSYFIKEKTLSWFPDSISSLIRNSQE